MLYHIFFLQLEKETLTDSHEQEKTNQRSTSNPLF